jgi:hypothetical protein
MGGPGSGNRYPWHRHPKKDTVEDCRSLDANRWMREGILKAGVHLAGTWAWYRDEQRKERTSSIGYEVCTLGGQPWLRLHYTITPTREPVDYRIVLATTRPRFGGLRWWFVCPLIVGGQPCQRRVGKLHLPPAARSFGCRRCHELTYTSCQESGRFDGLYASIAARMGRPPAEVRRLMRMMERRNG